MLTTFTQVAEANDLQDGDLLLVKPEDVEILLVRVDGEFFAINAMCSHAYGFLDEGTLCGYQLQCPLHVGRFDVRNGQAVQLPATEPVDSYDVRIEDGKVLIGPRQN